MRQDQITGLIRVMVFFVAVVVWIISVRFSVDGFNIEVPDLQWIGFALAMCVTGTEIMLNHYGNKLNFTLLAVGIISYGYGLWTNIIGIAAMQGVTSIFAEPEKAIFPIILALIIEIAPEPLLILAITGDSPEDFFTQLFGRKSSGGGGFSMPKGKSGFSPMSDFPRNVPTPKGKRR